MKIKIEMDLTTEEAHELFVPGDKQQEFVTKTYDAYCRALQDMVWNQVDPHNMLRRTKNDE